MYLQIQTLKVTKDGETVKDCMYKTKLKEI